MKTDLSDGGSAIWSASETLYVRAWGTRGSVPVSGPSFQRYGGNTVCVEMRCGDSVLIFDAGSGIVPAGKVLKAEGCKQVQLLFSHCHYDHIIGLPYFAPIYDPEATVTISSGHLAGKMSTSEMIDQFMQPPWFPVTPKTCRSQINYRDFRAGDVLAPCPDVVVKTCQLDHPGGAIGYRVEWGGRIVAFITDTEHTPGTLDPNVLALIENADVFLYDASYTDEEMEKYKGFGHSSWQQGIRLARAANAKSVGFLHHSPWRTDHELDKMGRAASEEFAGAFVARDGQTMRFQAI
ncbi:MBL fold metallo-hydrolase [Hartmannibacter diazotrophicus]|nr:MBL fold metallo-hydrolase [Hartmannibacter diazotrophicus]